MHPVVVSDGASFSASFDIVGLGFATASPSIQPDGNVIVVSTLVGVMVLALVAVVLWRPRS